MEQLYALQTRCRTRSFRVIWGVALGFRTEGEGLLMKPTPEAADHLKNDADRGKGSLEPDEQKQDGNVSLRGQLPHRNKPEITEGADTDFPEPGSSPEHSFEGEVRKRS